jgi:N-acetylneuraminic acid mutarotase
MMRQHLATVLGVCLFVSPSFASRLAVRSTGSATARTLTFADRVRAQDAIERVYYRHQIGTAKPFEEAVSRVVIEAKVHRYLEESAAVETLWKTPITDVALERELERMAGGTRLPERLKELFAALDNDAFLVKECVARATLADRLARNFYAYDPRFHAAARAAIDALHDQLASGALSPTASHPNRRVRDIATDPKGDARPSPSRRVSPATLDEWRAQLPPPGQVSPVVESRDAFSIDVVISESPTVIRVASYIVPKIAWDAWISTARASIRTDSVAAVASTASRLPAPAQGATFDPGASCKDGWNNGILDDVPDGRLNHAAVWTGSVMLVWGGLSGSEYLDTGGRYDPLTDTWQPMTTVNAPRGRVDATAIWTGSEMIVWGGREIDPYLWFVSGGRYDPISDRWTRMALAPTARRGNTAIWTGSRMIVWGGYFDPGNGPQYLSTGAIYDPSSDSWTPTATEGAPSGRQGHTATWTGREMIVWGGFAGLSSVFGDGRRYDPSTNSWSPMAGTSSRAGHAAVWTGSSMVVWGGAQWVPCRFCPGGRQLVSVNSGERYDPARDLWVGMSTAGAPHPGNSWLTAWTGHLMLVLESGGATNAGRYDPSTDHWTGLALDEDSPPPTGASLVWTGSQAIVWGGAEFSHGGPVYLNSGRRYDPWSDSWTPTSTSGPASGRSDHSAMWTGREMIVWGGRSLKSASGYLDSGGRYDPVTDSWTAMTTASAPVPRGGHTALWTGGEMLVWGGTGSDGNLDSGGRYDPGNDDWSSISSVGAPSPRTDHAAVWTGRRMVVWGGSANMWDGLQSGGVYDPATDRWTPTTLASAPSPRWRHTAIWTGSRVVIWGGVSGDPYTESTNSGGQYDPETDAWTPTSLDGAPTPRSYHTAVWAGGRMVVWGGLPQDFTGSVGGRYDPVGDSWVPVTTLGEPISRYGHSAVAAGNLMLVWGGRGEALNAPNTGGVYDVVNDRWTKFARVGAAASTSGGTVIWTGDAMIVWTGMGGSRYFLGHDDDCDGDGLSDTAGDCDDHDPASHPGAPERCDGIANDCAATWWPFADGEYDEDRDGWLTCAGDCNDNNVYVHPGAAEVCDGWDTDCDGQMLPQGEADADRDGYRVCEGDCDDTNSRVHPGSYEWCNGLDDDCNGVVDDGGDALCNNSTQPCYVGYCRGAEGCFITTPDLSCDDGNSCTVDDRCSGGRCLGTPTTGTSCDDGNECTANDTCQDDWCQGQARDGAACNDHDACTTGESCHGGYCFSGTPLNCAKDDGNLCNGREACSSAVGCYHYDVPNCDDGNICTTDSCDPATGCRHVFNDAPCDDGNACTAGDVCGGGVCHAGVAITCDDGNVCTDDTCAPWTGCVHTNNSAACDDATACTRWDVCDAGVCVGHDPVVCPAGDQCLSVAACDPATGLCPAVAKPDGLPCDDGDLCTGGDTCRAGTCTPAFSGLSEPNPRTDGYYRGLCDAPHSGDHLTDADARCVAALTRTFARIATVADLCARLTPSRPNSDPCDRTEDDLMTLALNICRARVCTEQTIDSQCGSAGSAGRSLAEIDEILAGTGRNDAACAHAKCLADEINTGRALRP